MNRILYKLLNLVLCSMFVLTWSCNNNEWDKHYDEEVNRGDQVTNLVNALRDKGYTAYAAALEKLKFDAALNSGMGYTLFVIPDSKFTSATQGMNDAQLSAYMLNTIFTGKYLSSGFTQASYQPMAGDPVTVSIKDNVLTNLHKETVQITKKDIQIPNAILFEISDFLPQYPDAVTWLKDNGYASFLAKLKTNYIIDSTYTEKAIGFRDGGLSEVAKYPKNIFQPTQKPMSHIVFVVPTEVLYQTAANNTKTKMESYMVGATNEVKEMVDNFQTDLFVKNVGISYEHNGENIDVKHTDGTSTVSLPVSKITKEIKLSQGNTIILADTLFQPIWEPEKEQLWNCVDDRTAAQFVGKGFGGWGDWCSYVWVNQNASDRAVGDKVIFTFPPSVLYTAEYEVEVRYQNGKSWPKVKFLVNDQYLGDVDLRDNTNENRWDGACERNGNTKLPNTIKFTDFTQPVVVTFEVISDWGTGGELMAPFSVFFRLKE